MAQLCYEGIKMDVRLKAAHKHCIFHRDEIMASNYCGCFHCVKLFQPSQIEIWTDDDTTALCPFCYIDAVIGDAAGFTLTEKFLTEMKAHWFDASGEVAADDDPDVIAVNAAIKKYFK